MNFIAALLFTVCFLANTNYSQGARILAVLVIPSYSHQVPFRPIWKDLIRRGHEVVVVASDPMNDPSLTNLTEISTHNLYPMLRVFDFVNLKNKMPWLRFISEIFWETSLRMAEAVFKLPEMQKLCAPDNTAKFDVVLAEAVWVPSIYALAHRFNCPLIGIFSMPLTSALHYRLGAPVLPSHPSTWEMEDATGLNLSFWKRLKNFVRLWYALYIRDTVHIPLHQELARKYFGDDVPPIADLEKNMSLVFVNQDPVTSYARPMATNVIPFNTFHVHGKATPLQNDVKRFIDGASNGFIYFSLGTNVHIKNLNPSIRRLFRNVFSKLPYRVVWKYDEEMPDKPDNVFLGQWFSQQSILGHPKIKLFIYQGGLQSTEEAVHFAVPVLGMPVLSDQESQVRRMESLGVGKKLNILSLSEDDFEETLNEMLTNERYKENMLKLSTLSRDKPGDMIDTVTWWIEFVIRHKGAAHLQTSIRDEPWYQRLEMDVVAFLSISVFILFMLVLTASYKILLVGLHCYTLCSNRQKTKTS